MIKFMLVSRRKPGDTQEKYFYEWGIIHVALMITTPSVMRTFRRYAQHFTVNGVDGDRLLYPLSDMAWDNFADHWLDRPEDNLVPFRLGRLHAAHASAQLRRLELRHRVRARDVQGRGAGLRARGRQARARRQEPAGPGRGRVRRRVAGAARRGARSTAGATRPGRLVQNLHAEVDRKDFKGTLFELAGVGGYAGVEELWFDDLESLLRFTEDEAVRAAVLGEDSPVDPAGSFSLVVTERVVYDYTRGAESSPPPAVLDPRQSRGGASTPRSTRAGTCRAGSERAKEHA